MIKSPEFDRLHLDEELRLYEPDASVLRELGDAAVWAVVAGYNSGKDSVIDWLIENHSDIFARIVGDTTRPSRPGEVDGVDYHFLTDQEAAKYLHEGRFVQVTPPIGDYFYATRPEQYPRDKIGIKPIQARTMREFRRLGFKEARWLQLVPSSYEAWLSWQDPNKRQHTGKDLSDRDREFIESISLALTNPDTYFIYNDSIPRAGERIVMLAQGRPLRDTKKVRGVAVDLLEAHKKRLGIT